MPNSRGFLFGFSALALGFPALAQPASDVGPVDERNLPEIVARVNGVDIKRSALRKAAEAMKKHLEVIGQSIPRDQKDETLRRLLDEIIVDELLAQEASRQKLTVSEPEVLAEVTRFRERFPSEAVFQSFLKEQGFNEKQLRVETRKQLSIRKMLDKEVFADSSVDAATAEAYYQKNPAKFQEPEAVRASHILVKVDRSADEKTRTEARKKAERILADARAGEDFARLAKEHSDDPGSRDRGGDLDFFFFGQMVSEFDEAAFSLRTGEVSNIVTTAFGFHIIKVVDKRPKRAIPFADVKADLIELLAAEERGDSLERYIETLRNKAKIQIYI